LKLLEPPEQRCYYLASIEHPSVSGRTSRGARTFWTIRVGLVDKAHEPLPVTDATFEAADAVGCIVVESFQERGKVRDVVPTYVTKGKNAGKKNSTNAFSQAIRDAFTLYNKKLKVSSSGISDERPPPMLVKTNGDTRQATLTEDDLDTGVIAQTKLNGVRLVAYLRNNGGRSEVVMYSRTGSLYPGMDNIRAELKEILQRAAASGAGGYYLDGEIYRHGESLLWISGQSRREQDDSSLEYHVFDCFDPKNPQESGIDRQNRLDGFLAPDSGYSHVKRVENFYPQSMEDVHALFQQFVREGYEGIILRRATAPYVFSVNGSRSSDVLRIKPKLHAEFKCVGFTQGDKGKDKGAIIWICEPITPKDKPITPKDKPITPKGAPIPPKDKPAGNTFHVLPKNMTYELRYKLFRFLSRDDNFDRYLSGRPLTVEFDEYSKKTGFPLRAKAEAFRTYEDSDADPMREVVRLANAEV
jgi:hypothetical protein